MLIVDSSCLVEVAVGGLQAGAVQSRLDSALELAAPHVIDVEVLGVVRREYLRGALDGTAASLAIQALRDWPGERFGHRLLLERAWQLRANVRGWDAFYVALAELLDAPLLTLDERLSRAPGLRCTVEVPA